MFASQRETKHKMRAISGEREAAERKSETSREQLMTPVLTVGTVLKPTKNCRKI